jgi:hypothetical protein
MNDRSSALIAVGKWGGRVTAFLLFLFWGAFFIEHLSEWFIRSDGIYPPPGVWISQIFHGLMIAGLLLMLRWHKAGTILLLAGTIGFFGSIGEMDLIPLSLINLVPVAFFTMYQFAQKKHG